MTTIYIEKRYAGNGTTEPRRLMTFKLRSLEGRFGGYTWHILFDNGDKWDTRHISRGKSAFTKKELQVIN